MTGAVSGERLEALLDKEETLERLKQIAPSIYEGRASFPDEDFLQEHKDALTALQKNLRGDNRERLGGIIEALDDLAMTTFYETEYGRSELYKALQIIERIEQ